mmetsp:Transcript_32186/g.92674  ORF Transcript_32186/g.92674 Transcript_32186/m.92674 type:complete len:236 (-) Transcript_32186:104-811(-)
MASRKIGSGMGRATCNTHWHLELHIIPHAAYSSCRVVLWRPHPVGASSSTMRSISCNNAPNVAELLSTWRGKRFPNSRRKALVIFVCRRESRLSKDSEGESKTMPVACSMTFHSLDLRGPSGGSAWPFVCNGDAVSMSSGTPSIRERLASGVEASRSTTSAVSSGIASSSSSRCSCPCCRRLAGGSALASPALVSAVRFAPRAAPRSGAGAPTTRRSILGNGVAPCCHDPPPLAP